jgi:hypothetical protein
MCNRVSCLSAQTCSTSSCCSRCWLSHPYASPRIWHNPTTVSLNHFGIWQHVQWLLFSNCYFVDSVCHFPILLLLLIYATYRLLIYLNNDMHSFVALAFETPTATVYKRIHKLLDGGRNYVLDIPTFHNHAGTLSISSVCCGSTLPIGILPTLPRGKFWNSLSGFWLVRQIRLVWIVSSYHSNGLSP